MRPEGSAWFIVTFVFFCSVIIPVSDSLKCFQCGTPNKISCEDFLPLPEHYTECEGNSCVSTLGRFESVMVETKECGPELVVVGRREECSSRELGGGARVRVCHCRDNFCNKYSVRDTARPWSTWWSHLAEVLQVNI